MDMDIATSLKEFRQQHAMEQDELARLLGTTQQTVSNWENGTVPRSGALRKISHLMATYRKDEPQPPMPPRPVFDPAISAVHDIRVKSERDTKLAVVDLLDKVTDRQSRLLSNSRTDMLREFSEALPDALKAGVRRQLDAQGLVYRFDYASDKIICDLCVVAIRNLGGRVNTLSTQHVIHSLWRMSSHRLLTRKLTPDRDYCLFVHFEKDTALPVPLNILSRITTEADIHGIKVIWSDAKLAAAFVDVNESGASQIYMQDGDEDDEH